MVDFIRGQLPEGEQLAQLAEEAGELAHAALKLRRAIDGTNPTPVTMSNAFANLEEEVADVLVCLEVLGYNLVELPRYRMMMDSKLTRWANRLNGAKTDDKTESGLLEED